MSKNYVDNIFLISSVGQLNNVFKLIESNDLKGQSNGCVILWTKANRQIADKLTEKAQLVFRHILRICLPLNPTGGHLYTVYKCKKAYSILFEEFNIKSVWVANSNSHYSLFLSMCVSYGLEINYYEEGLGTYKSKDMLLNSSSSRDNLRKFGLEVKRGFLSFTREFWLDWIFSLFKVVVRKLIAPAKFLAIIIGAATKYLFNSQIFKRRVAPLLPKPYADYYDLHTEFSKIHVVFPEFLDKTAFRGELCEFPFRQENFILNPQELEQLGDLNASFGPDSCIYISQKYSSDSKKWALILSQTLKSQSVTNLFIKFHPKEKMSERVVTLNILDANGINVVDIDPANNLDALKLIASLKFGSVYGLTSSVLFYGQHIAPNTNFISLAPSFEVIGKSKRLCIGGIEVMMRDYMLMSRLI